MADVLISPGIQITETDKSYVPTRPVLAGAALVGPTAKGPVLVPTKITSYAQFLRTFGSTFEIEVEATETTPKRTEKQEYMTSIAAKSYFEQGGDSVIVTRVADPSQYDVAESTTIEGGTETEEKTREVPNMVPQMETVIIWKDPETGEEVAEGTEGAVSESVEREVIDPETGEPVLIQSGTIIETYTEEKTIEPFKLYSLSEGEFLNNVAGSSYRPYEPNDPESEEESSEEDYDERADGSMISGSNQNFRFEIADVDSDRGTFSLYIRRGDDTDKQKVVLEAWQNLSLDPYSPNYIAARIGDQYPVFKLDADGIGYIDVSGDYLNKSAYVRVEVLTPTPNYLDTEGKPDNKYAEMLPKVQKGGFIGGKGKPGELPEGAEEGDEVVYFDKITRSTEYPQGIDCKFFEDAFDLLRNADEYNFNILTAPGLLGANAENGISKMVSVAEERGDCIAIPDLAVCSDTTDSVKESAQKVNSSYAAAYWPWVQVYSATGKMVWVPASVIIPGVYASNDKMAAPWFAPAGLNRGTLGGVIQTRRKLVKAERDKLYKTNVNPIASFPGSGIVIYGQKTLQKKASALDRVNVRRLLIELKENVKKFAGKVLFEHNTVSVRNSFRAELETYLSSVVVRQGLYDYKVILDELNDPETIDRNEFRCQIILQPTKVIEFVYVDFTITNTGVEFNS